MGSPECEKQRCGVLNSRGIDSQGVHIWVSHCRSAGPASLSLRFPMCDVETVFYLRLFMCTWHMAHNSHNGGVLGFVVGSTAKWVRAGQQAERGRKEKILVCQLALSQLRIFNSNSFLSEPIGGDPLWSWLHLQEAGVSGVLGLQPPHGGPHRPQNGCSHVLLASWVAPKRQREGGSRLHAQVTPPIVERSRGHREARGVTQVALPPQSWDRE